MGSPFVRGGIVKCLFVRVKHIEIYWALQLSVNLTNLAYINIIKST